MTIGAKASQFITNAIRNASDKAAKKFFKYVGDSKNYTGIQNVEATLRQKELKKLKTGDETLDKLITKASNNKSTRENLSKFIQSGDFLKVKSAKTGPITLPGRGQAVDEGLFQSIGKREATVVDEDFDNILTRIEKDLELEEARKKYAKDLTTKNIDAKKAKTLRLKKIAKDKDLFTKRLSNLTTDNPLFEGMPARDALREIEELKKLPAKNKIDRLRRLIKKRAALESVFLGGQSKDIFSPLGYRKGESIETLQKADTRSLLDKALKNMIGEKDIKYPADLGELGSVTKYMDQINNAVKNKQISSEVGKDLKNRLLSNFRLTRSIVKTVGGSQPERGSYIPGTDIPSLERGRFGTYTQGYDPQMPGSKELATITKPKTVIQRTETTENPDSRKAVQAVRNELEEKLGRYPLPSDIRKVYPELGKVLDDIEAEDAIRRDSERFGITPPKRIRDDDLNLTEFDERIADFADENNMSFDEAERIFISEIEPSDEQLLQRLLEEEEMGRTRGLSEEIPFKTGGLVSLTRKKRKTIPKILQNKKKNKKKQQKPRGVGKALRGYGATCG